VVLVPDHEAVYSFEVARREANREQDMSKALRTAAAAVALSCPVWAQLFMVPTLLAQETADYEYWSAFQLDNLGRSLADQTGANNAAVLDRIVDYGHYFAAIVHREPGPGFSESHADWADVYFVTSGNASLIVGGTIPDGEETEPGEVRGTTIENGTLQRLAKGDVVHIPAGTPHHVLVEPGEQVTYFIFKVQAP
jgi:mannose-6-phosphate isomerase-like protein (cupin superfamily)